MKRKEKATPGKKFKMEAELPRVTLKGFYTQNLGIPVFPVKEAESIYQLSTFHRALIIHLFQFSYRISK